MLTEVRLTPPWYTLRNKLNAAITQNIFVTVGELNTSHMPYTVSIFAEDPKKGAALASILTPKYPMGRIEVDVVFPEGIRPQVPKSPEELADLVTTALRGTPYFVRTEIEPFGPGMPRGVWAVFAPKVIQFFNDDISDLYGNFNDVAAFVYRDLLVQQAGGIGLRCATEKV